MTRDSTRKEGRAHPDDPRVRILLHRIAAACRNTLGDTLAGVYVHGSLAFGCFCWTQSDIDFLVAVRRPLSQAQKEALLRALLALEPDAPSKGLEMSAVLEAYCRSFIHPAPYELHYSPMHRARCLRDLPASGAELPGADPDLAAQFTVARAVGLPLGGPPAESMFGPVPRAAYLDSIRQDVGTACSDILRTPASTTLNLCRTLAFAQEGLVLSKEQGGLWAACRLPPPYAGFAQSAAESYRSGAPFLPAPAQAQAFAAFLLPSIFHPDFFGQNI